MPVNENGNLVIKNVSNEPVTFDDFWRTPTTLKPGDEFDLANQPGEGEAADDFRYHDWKTIIQTMPTGHQVADALRAGKIEIVKDVPAGWYTPDTPETPA